ncbi:hypothetical protein [Streptomyces sp. NPDC001889]
MPAPLPRDLVQLQTAWDRTYAALAAPGPTGRSALRRRLLLLSVRLHWHPHWSSLSTGAAASQRLRLRALAQQHPTGTDGEQP